MDSTRQPEDSAAPTVQHVTLRQHSHPAYAAYAEAYDADLTANGITGRPAVVDVALPEASGTVRTFVLETGEGTPVLFLHGTPATSAVWLPLLGGLSGVHAYLVDRPGHGLSGDLDYATVPDLRAHAVGFVEGLLDALGLERVVLAGSSLGGLWALWSALDRPDRVTAVIAAAPPGMLRARLPFIFGLLAVPSVNRILRRLDSPSPASTRRLFKHMGDPPDLLSDALVTTFTRGQQLPNVEGGTTHLIQRFVEFPGRFAHRTSWLSADDLGQVRQPTLLMWGARDFLGAPSVARGIVDVIPDAELAEVGSGHLSWLQDPSGAAQAIRDFLERRVPDGPPPA